MKIAHIYNNNVVLAENTAGERSVVIGRGLAFNKKRGQELDPAKIEQTFVPESSQQQEYSATLLSEIPSEVLVLASELEDYAHTQLGLSMSHSFVLPLADHLNYALKRAHDGIAMDYPLAVEVEHLYPREVAFGRYTIELVKDRFGVALQDGEATAFAMHLVNTMFSEADLAKTYAMTEVFAQIFNVIAFAYGQPLDQNHVSVSRFVTHLRYLFVRVESGQAVTRKSAVPAVQQAVQISYPKADSCALKVKMLLEMHLGVQLSADEQTYLTIHIARLAEDLWNDSSQS